MKDMNADVRKESLFKNSILSSAEAKSMSIIAEAEKKRQDELEAARAASIETDETIIAARVGRSFEKELSAEVQKARQDLLLYRAQLTDKLFAEVRGQLQSFAQSEGYLPWLAGKLEQYQPQNQAATLTVYLREADAAFAPRAQEILPGCRVETTTAIELGGAKISDGRRLYDETLEAGLKAEQEAFYAQNKLSL